MRKNEGRMVGILGTISLHLIAGIIFMSFQMKSLQKDMTGEFAIEFAPVEATDDQENQIELPATSVENILQGDEELLNIARNLANKSDVNINPDEYIDMVKEELIKSGKLSEDNFIDEKKIQKEEGVEDKMTYEDSTKMDIDSEQPEESQEMASNYKGPTRIYYDLEGRTHTILPVPIYKCQGSGKVALLIEVNQKGYVEKALIIEKESTTSDPCLLETAVKTALKSKFNGDMSFPKIQTGTLTYHFVAQ